MFAKFLTSRKYVQILIMLWDFVKEQSAYYKLCFLLLLVQIHYPGIKKFQQLVSSVVPSVADTSDYAKHLAEDREKILN